ncbi:MAG: hypothetical protein E7658_04980 [Ruminococcaceae bacterium]|nr:hypothetical protein [Oscillospiraceae bacterium]
MPKGIIYKVPVNKDVFSSVVKECNSSIIKLGECEEIKCTERTIRRSLKEGKITPCYLEQIAKYLNVDTRLLSGDLHKQADNYKDYFLKSMYLAQLKVENYPYFRKRKSDLDKQPIEGLIEQILALFQISFSQFEDMDFEHKYLLQYDLLDAMFPVMRKHFSVDAYGRKDMPELERIIYELENFREEHYRHLYADEVLRKKFLKKTPNGKTKSEINRMSTEDLIVLDLYNNHDE